MMKLKSEIVGSTVEYEGGEKMGRVRDLVVDTTSARWPIVGLVVAPLVGGRERLLTPGPHVALSYGPRGHRVRVHSRVPLDALSHAASSRDHFRLSLLDRAKAVGHDSEPVGSVYDAVVVTSTTPWHVQRLLVSPKGLNSKRLRVSTAHVRSVARKQVQLAAGAGSDPAHGGGRKAVA